MLLHKIIITIIIRDILNYIIKKLKKFHFIHLKMSKIVENYLLKEVIGSG